MLKFIVIVLEILGALVAILAVAVLIGTLTFKSKVQQEVKEMFSTVSDANPGVVTEDDLSDLPEPVQRWLRYSQVVGREKVRTVRLKQKGQFRLGPDRDWIPFEAAQYYRTGEPAFIWYTTMKMAPLVFITGRDKYMNGRGNMLIKMEALVNVVDATGPEMDQGTLLRYLNEIMWFPQEALSEYIQWEAVDDSSARATMDYKGRSASAMFYYDDQGRVTNMIGDRYMEVQGEYEMRPWSTPIEEYREFNGHILPYKGTGLWQLSSGDFPYIRLEVTDLEYNTLELY